jgi:hypothetical protein
MLHLIGVRGVYVLAAAGCAVATLVLVSAMRELADAELTVTEEPVGELGEAA